MLSRIVVKHQATKKQIWDIVEQSVFSFAKGIGPDEDLNGMVNPRILDAMVTSTASTDPKLYVTREEIEGYKKAFETNYRAIDASAHPVLTNWYPDIVVSWTKFMELATDNGRIIDTDTLALRFIHCYHPDDNRWYLTMQRMWIDIPVTGPVTGVEYPIAAIPPPPPPPVITERQTLTSIYQQRNGLGNATPSGADLRIRPYKMREYYYDNDYLTRVKDKAGVLALDKHAFSITFSYQEILELQKQNNPGLIPESEFDIVFFSVSYDMGPAPVPPATSPVCNVQWPHSIAMHMRCQGADCLNNDAVVLLGAAAGKASDLGGICPPRDNNIVWQL